MANKSNYFPRRSSHFKNYKVILSGRGSQEALEGNNIDKIGEEAHTLKGVAGNLGLNKVYQYSVELMRLAKENNLVEIKKVVAELEEEIEKVISALKNL